MELTFSAGTTRNCRDIPIEDNNILEGTENLFANLITFDPDVILEPDMTQILIFEDPNDGMCAIIIIPQFIRNHEMYVWFSTRCDNWF